VVRVHDGALAEEYALSSTTLVVVEVCLAQVQLTSALHASHARCATTESTATMRVQNYGGSRIKRGSCCSGRIIRKFSGGLIASEDQGLDISVTVFVGVFVWLRISPPRIKLEASNFAPRFIGVQGRESPILGNFAPPEARNRTNRPARKQRMFTVLVEYVRAKFYL